MGEVYTQQNLIQLLLENAFECYFSSRIVFHILNIVIRKVNLLLTPPGKSVHIHAPYLLPAPTPLPGQHVRQVVTRIKESGFLFPDSSDNLMQGLQVLFTQCFQASPLIHI